MIDINYYKTVLATQNKLETIKGEFGDLINEIEQNKVEWNKYPETKPPEQDRYWITVKYKYDEIHTTEDDWLGYGNGEDWDNIRDDYVIGWAEFIYPEPMKEIREK